MPLASSPATFATLDGAPTDNAALAAALAGAGGGSIVDTGVAYVDASGNDTTGDGTASAPWLSAQKAVNEGYRVIRGGVGSFGNIALTSGSAIHLQLLGVGRTRTTFGNITLTAPGGSVSGNGRNMLTVGDITIAPATAAAGAAGVDPFEVGSTGGEGTDALDSSVTALTCGSLTLRGGHGGAGGAGGPGDNDTAGGGNGGAGGSGGLAATLTINDCEYTTSTSTAGNGGDGGPGGDDINTPGDGGNGGAGQNGGGLMIIGSVETGGHSTPPSGGGGGGAGGIPGTDGDAGSEAGTTTVASFSNVITGTDTTDTVTASILDGVFVA
jgi:hypothetical protein